jgi:peptidoglycan/LPS O-acetylase OafA/YrhL
MSANAFAKHRFHTLDGMRGIAALAVMLYHYHVVPGHTTWLLNGPSAVDFFFILSGFVVLHGYGAKLENGMTARAYLARRVARLWPLMALGVLVGLPAAYMQRGSAGALLGSVAANLCFLPYLGSNALAGSSIIFPTDDPLWSIFFEMVASIAFIWLAKIGSNKWLGAISAASLALVLIGALIRTHQEHYNGLDVGAGYNAATFLGGFPRVAFGFVLGMLIYRIYGERRPGLSIHPAFLYLVLAAMLAFPYHVGGAWYFIAAAVFSPLLVYYGSVSIGLTWLSEYLGWLSFPIYCLHRPVLHDVLLLAAVVPHLPVKLVAVVVTLGLSAGASWVLDQMGVNRRIVALFEGRGVVVAAIAD